VRVVYLPRGAPAPPALVGLEEVHAAHGGQIAAPANGLATLSFTLPEPSGYRFQLRLVDVTVPTSHPYHASVYIFPSNLSFSPAADFRRKYKASAFGMFASAGDMHHSTQTLQLDVTDALRAAPRDQIGSAWTVVIEFRAADKGLAYGAIAGEVGVRRVELLRRDYATVMRIPLR
jgi:hypothetical protein